MHSQVNADPWTHHRVVLDLLISNHPAPGTLGELARALASGDEGGAEPSTVDAEDALRDLYACGLVHRAGGFYVATRAAVEGARLAV
jgi:hypothetical protein